MPWTGSGTFVTADTFVPGSPATAEDQNTQDTDIAAGITNTLARDGQAPATANIPLGGNKIIGMANGTLPTDGAAFGQLATLIPAGIVLATASNVIPVGWLVCQGQAVSRTTYAALFAAIGGIYGAGDGVSTFNVPSLVGRVIAGVDPTGTVLNSFTINNAAVPGGFGGNQAHVLTTAEMPVHNHAIAISDPGHVHGYVRTPTIGLVGAGGVSVTGVTDQAATITDNAVTGITASAANTGSSSAHAIVQPTMIMFYIIKT